MLGFVAALGAELSTGQTIFSQVNEAPALILITFITFAIASLLPLVQNQMPESRANSFFTSSAEMLNGRAACVSFCSSCHECAYHAKFSRAVRDLILRQTDMSMLNWCVTT